MDCKWVEDNVSRYIENDLSASETQAIDAHIQSCPDCRQLLERMEKVMFLCGDLSEEVPFFLKNRLYNIIESQEPEAPAISERTAVVLKWAVAMVGSLVLLLNLLYFTSIVPSANRFLHLAVSRIQTMAVEAGAYMERISESERNPFLGLFKTNEMEMNVDNVFPDAPNHEGGKNG